MQEITPYASGSFYEKRPHRLGYNPMNAIKQPQSVDIFVRVYKQLPHFLVVTQITKGFFGVRG